MLATASALTTGDVHLAEDLTQSALVRLYLAWGRARGPHARAYARRVLLNCFLDHRRRRWVRSERSVDVTAHLSAGLLPDTPAVVVTEDPELLAATGTDHEPGHVHHRCPLARE